MYLAELVHELGGSYAPARGAGPKITGVHLDSRRAGAGDLFAALPGTRDDGARFARDAVERGASAVLTPRLLELPSDRRDVPAPPQWVHPDARRVVGEAARRVYGEPARDMFVVGVTGTNGKTTTAHLTGQLLRRAGRRPAVLGTAGNRLADGELRPTGHTTPDAPELQRLMRDHRELGGDSVAMEASSHALDQQRTAGLEFDVGVFTNLTRDHLDYHHDLEHYVAAKELLFTNLRPGGSAVLNADDPTSERFAKSAQRQGARVFKYSARLRSDLCASQLSTDLSGSRFVLTGMGISRTKVSIPLIGRFNVENALAAAAAALLSGASPSSILEGLASASSAPGRFESVDAPGIRERGFRVLVDYAHTEAALENVCRVLRQSLSHAKTRRGRLIVVFGCGGDRDTGKRAPMGRAVNEFADVAIVTSDNPRSEDPAAIVDAILAGMEPRQAERVVELDRRRAIEIAIARAQPGDVVLIAGKGHETTQTVGSAVLAFDDRKVAAEVSR